MSFLLDTNVCIAYLRRRGATLLSEKIHRVNPSQIFICTIVRAELMTGAYKSTDVARNSKVVGELLSLFPSLPFDEKSADIYGKVRADLEKTGFPIGGNDLMIASIALANNLTMVTHNSREFSHVSELRLEDWQ